MVTVTNEPPKKRRRPPSACIQCRRRKIKCDQNAPCDQCIRSKSDTCTYLPVDPVGYRKQRRSSIGPASSTALASDGSPHGTFSRNVTDASAPEKGVPDNSQGGQRDGPIITYQTLATRINILESSVSDLTLSGRDYHETISPSSGSKVEGIINKTRLFGQNHWMHTALQVYLILPFTARSMFS